MSKPAKNKIKPLTAPAEAARLAFCITLSCGLYALIVWLAARFYHPDITAALEAAKATVYEGLHNDIKPEPLERLLYAVSIIFFPLCLSGLYALTKTGKAGRWFENIKFSNSVVLCCLAVWLGCGISTLLAPNPNYQAGFMGSDNFAKCFGVYFGHLMLYQKPAIDIFVFIIVWLVFLWNARTPQSKAAKVTAWLPRLAGYAIGIVMLAVILMMIPADFPETWQWQFNLDAVYYSQTQVYAGCALLTDNLTNTYGLYPHFLNPIFQITGLSVHTFTWVMAVLIVLGYILLYLGMHFAVKNPLIRILGFVTIVYFTYISININDLRAFDPYFAANPLRTFFPFLMFFLAGCYSHKRFFKKFSWPFITGCILMPLAVLWVPDLGSVTFVAWCIYILYVDFFNENGKIAWKKEALNVLCLAGGFIVAWGTFILAIYLKYGKTPDFGLLLETMNTFSIGFFTIPMPAWHPWIIAAFTGVAGLALGLAKFFGKKAGARDAFAMLTALMVFGTFAYFQGRSHNSCLYVPMVYALLMLVLFTDIIWDKVCNREKIYWIPFSLLLFTLCFSTHEAYNAFPVYQKATMPRHGNPKAEDQDRIKKNKTYMYEKLQGGKEATVLTSKKYQCLYYDNKKLRSGLNPGIMEIFLQQSYENMIDSLLQSTAPVFIDQTYLYYNDFNRIRSAVASRYKVEDIFDKNFSYCLPRKEEIKPDTLLFDPAAANRDIILYRHYSDLTDGCKQRIQDAAGTEAAIAGNNFSLEFVFKNTLQHYQAILASNQADSTGMNIYSYSGDGTGNSIRVCLADGMGLNLNLPIDQWCYVAVNWNDRYVNIFFNGNYTGTIDMTRPYRISEKNISIGNQGTLHDFIGALSEVCVRNGNLSLDQMQRNWNKVQALYHN